MKRVALGLIFGVSLLALIGCGQSDTVSTTDSTTTGESTVTDRSDTEPPALPGMTEIQGRVIHAVSGDPVPNIPINAIMRNTDPNLPPPAPITGTTDATGQFSLLGAITGKTYSIEDASETMVVGTAEITTGSDAVTALAEPLPAIRDFGFRGLLLLDPTADRSVAEIPRRPNNRLTYLRQIVPTVTGDRVGPEVNFTEPQTLWFYYCRSGASAEAITALRQATAVSASDTEISVELQEEKIPLVSEQVVGQGEKGEVVLLKATVPALTEPTFFGTHTVGRYNLVYLFELDPAVQ